MSSVIAKTRLLNKVAVCTASTNGLLNKVAICTASTNGIGFAIAKRLAQEGAKVVVSSRNKENVDEAVKQLQNEGLDVIGSVCHVSNEEHRRKMYQNAYDHFGGIDILVSMAGVNPHSGFVMDCPPDKWDKIFDVNVKSTYLLSKEVIPYMEKRNGGNIIYMSSILGVSPLDVMGAYSVSKCALLGLTKTAAQSLACKNIRVNCIAPGLCDTEFSRVLTSDPVIHARAMGYIAMKRFGTADDMSGLAAYLASDDAKYLTGETINVNGGLITRL